MPRKPGTRQANKEQLAQRHGLIREALSQCMNTVDIVSTFSKDWNVVPRTIEGYITKVRAEAGKVSLQRLSPIQKAAEQNLVIEGIKRTVAEAWAKVDAKNKPAPDTRTAQKGLELLGKAYGVFTEQLEITGAGGGPLQFAGSPGLTKMLQRLEQEAQKRKAAATAAKTAP